METLRKACTENAQGHPQTSNLAVRTETHQNILNNVCILHKYSENSSNFVSMTRLLIEKHFHGFLKYTETEKSRIKTNFDRDLISRICNDVQG